MIDKVDEIGKILDEGKVDDKADVLPEREVTEEMSKEQILTWQIDKLCHEGVFRYELISVVQDLVNVLKDGNDVNKKLLKKLSELDQEDD